MQNKEKTKKNSTWYKLHQIARSVLTNKIETKVKKLEYYSLGKTTLETKNIN